MRALCWHAHGDVRVDSVPDPTIQHPRHAIIRITACAICGSDLHLYDGYQPTMKSGDILSGGQAEYLRVPMADVGPIKIPENVADEQALFLSDVSPTGYMAAENAQIKDGDTVAI
jgi:threonine dehydrogenase-like Zn-dependent dehydrogenase